MIHHGRVKQTREAMPAKQMPNANGRPGLPSTRGTDAVGTPPPPREKQQRICSIDRKPRKEGRVGAEGGGCRSIHTMNMLLGNTIERLLTCCCGVLDRVSEGRETRF